MGYLISVTLGYLLGSSNLALYIAKMKKIDLRSGGSGNLGASNATAMIGWRAGIAVAVHDVAKGLLAVLLAALLFPNLPNVGVAAGVACVMGHIFPFYLKFRGGKGFATFMGMTLALNWKLALALVLISVVITLVTDYIVLATTTTIFSVPGYIALAEHNYVAVCIILLATAVIVYKHRMNYVRIWKGTEIGLRSAARGEHRVR